MIIYFDAVERDDKGEKLFVAFSKGDLLTEWLYLSTLFEDRRVAAEGFVTKERRRILVDEIAGELFSYPAEFFLVTK